MNKNNLILMILIFLFSTGCRYDDIEITDVKNVKLGKTTTKEVNIKAVIELKNPNNYKIKLKKYDLDVKINGREFKVKDDNLGIKIPGKYSGTIPVSVKLTKYNNGIFSFDNLLLFAEIIKNRSVELEAHGYFRAGVFIMSKSINVNQKRTVKFN